MISFFKKYKFQFVIALIFTTMYLAYDFYTISHNEYKTFTGDEINLYVPHFFHMHESIRNFVFHTGDYLTANHSTEFMLRPNVPSFNLIYIASAIFPIDSVTSMYYAITIILFLFMFFSMVYSQLIGLYFFKLNKYYSMLLAILFVFSSQTMLTKAFEPFIFIHLSFPILVFYSLLLKRVDKKSNVYLISLIFTFVYLLGYLPLSVFAVLSSLIFAIIYNMYICESSVGIKKSFKSFLQDNKNLLLAFLVGSAVVLPYYLAILIFNKAASTVPTGLEDVMNTYHLVAYDIFSMLSYGIYQFSKIETHTQYVGLIPISMLIAYAIFKINSMRSFDTKTVNVSLLIFIFTLFISFGNFFSLSDLFYFFVPALGKMHLPSRFMIISGFFLALAIVIIFKNLLKNKSLYSNYYKVFAFVSTLLVILINFKPFVEDVIIVQYINIELFGMELLVFSLFVLFFLKYSKVQIIILAGALIFLQNLTYKNYIAKTNHLEKNIIFNTQEMNNLVSFFDVNSPEKKIIKYLNLSSEITTYVPRNFPWYVQNRIKLSNYYGYEPHLASYREYRSMFPFYGTIDFNYVFNKGCDYIIVSNKDFNKYQDILENRVDKNIVYHLSNGETVYKLKSHIPKYAGGENGIIRNGSFEFDDNGWALDKSWSSKNGTLYNKGIWGGAYANSAIKTLVNGHRYQAVFKISPESATGNLTVFFGDKLTKTIDVTAGKKYMIDFIADGKIFLFASLDKLAIENVRLFPFDEYQQMASLNDDTSKEYNDGIISFDHIDSVDIKSFKTDFFGTVSYHLVVINPVTIDYKFFPSKTLRIEVENLKDGTKTDIYSTKIKLNSGEYLIEIKYTNLLVNIFLIFISLYTASIVFIVMRNMLKEKVFQGNKK